MEENKGWATDTLKEAPYYHENITPEEYDIERQYYYENFDLVKNGTYTPLWKQNMQNNF